MRHGLQKDYDDLKTQEAIFTLNKMAHLTGISSDIFDVSNRSDGSTPSEQDEDESEGICVTHWNACNCFSSKSGVS